jgi:hydroxylamine dehydrogenase
MTGKELLMNLFKSLSYFLAVLYLLCVGPLIAAEKADEGQPDVQSSPATKTCLACHEQITPGIVADWRTSRHSRVMPADAVKKSALEKRVSAENIPAELQNQVVGCYECHSLNAANHRDNFEHMGRKINVVVSPNDCRTCHPAEVQQFSGSKKQYAHKILTDNPVYSLLVNTIDGITHLQGTQLVAAKPSDTTLHETCLGCHGTRVEVKGTKSIETGMGTFEFPDLTNWPNQGVGRINPDGSLGACSACHTRHGFLIEVARKPYTCSQCHHEPDVPAWNVYEESKHGNIYSSKGMTWDFTAVPWKVGTDFKAPTCAACHNSLLVSSDNEVIAERSHNFGSRLWARLFGLIYSHPQPISGDTTIIKNKDSQPLPVTFSGENASKYLIDRPEQEKRLKVMGNICNGCHSSQWVQGHFAKLDATLKETNEMTLTATKLMVNAWEKGIEDKTNPFDETIEKLWVRQWLFYANSVRYASAMTGAPDYTSFKNGWWDLSENLQHMKDWSELKNSVKEKTK